jgi:hypothetical protein
MSALNYNYKGFALVERGNHAMVLATGQNEQELASKAMELNENPFNISSFEVVKVEIVTTFSLSGMSEKNIYTRLLRT